MNEEQSLLLEKAKESIRGATILLNNQLPDFATARTYYANRWERRVAKSRILSTATVIALYPAHEFFFD